MLNMTQSQNIKEKRNRSRKEMWHTENTNRQQSMYVELIEAGMFPEAAIQSAYRTWNFILRTDVGSYQ